MNNLLVSGLTGIFAAMNGVWTPIPLPPGGLWEQFPDQYPHPQSWVKIGEDPSDSGYAAGYQNGWYIQSNAGTFTAPDLVDINNIWEVPREQWQPPDQVSTDLPIIDLMGDSLEENTESAIIKALRTDPRLAALLPDHWDSDRVYRLPQIQVKCVKGEELIPYHAVYSIRCEVELKTKPKKEDTGGIWGAIQNIIIATDLDQQLTNDLIFIGAPAEGVTTTGQNTGDARTRVVRFSLRGYSKI